MSASLDQLPQPSLWSTLREAVRGSHQDYTQAPIGRAVILLAVPMVLEMLMESVFLVVDIFFVGRLGPDAVATVGITESLMVMIYAVAIGLAIGAAAVVARRIGEKDPDAAAHAALVCGARARARSARGARRRSCRRMHARTYRQRGRFCRGSATPARRGGGEAAPGRRAGG